jgi:hypothetical protein
MQGSTARWCVAALLAMALAIVGCRSNRLAPGLVAAQKEMAGEKNVRKEDVPRGSARGDKSRGGDLSRGPSYLKDGCYQVPGRGRIMFHLQAFTRPNFHEIQKAALKRVNSILTRWRKHGKVDTHKDGMYWITMTDNACYALMWVDLDSGHWGYNVIHWRDHEDVLRLYTADGDSDTLVDGETMTWRAGQTKIEAMNPSVHSEWGGEHLLYAFWIE